MSTTNRSDGVSHPAFYGYVDYTLDGRPFYVGKGVDRRVRDKKNRNTKHRNVVAKHGCVRVVEFASSIEAAAFDWEISTIRLLDTYRTVLGCNFTLGGDGQTGLRHTNETKAKVSIANRNRSVEVRARIGDAQRGKKRSSEFCQHLREIKTGVPRPAHVLEALRQANLGRKHTAEHKAKIGEAGRGRTHSEETKTKIGLANKGRKHTEEEKVKMRGPRKGKH